MLFRIPGLMIVVALALAPRSNASDGVWTPGSDPASPEPPGHRYHAAVYDSARHRMLVIGGSGVPSSVWSLDLESVLWQDQRPSGVAPDGLVAHTATLDPTRRRALVLGGNVQIGLPMNSISFLTLDAQPRWETTTTTGNAPTRRFSHCTIYDPVRDRFIVFGGYNGNFLNDLWALSAADWSWTRLSSGAQGPPVRDAAVMIYDPTDDRLVLFGGWDGSTYRNDLWEYQFATGIWSPVVITGSGSVRRRDMAVAFDPVLRTMLIFGGSNSEGEGLTHGQKLYLGGTPVWQPLGIGPPPPGRYGHNGVFDQRQRRFVIFGGARSFSSTPMSDTWAIPVNTEVWARVSGPQVPGPPARFESAAVFDPTSRRIFLWGGQDELGRPLRDLWSHEWFANRPWTFHPPLGTEPFARQGHTLIADPPGRRLVMFGGLGFDEAENQRYFNDTYAIDPTDSSRWTRIETTGTPPPARSDHAAAFDSRRRRMIVTGGMSGYFRDVWALALEGEARWTQITPSNFMGGRRGHSAIYDSLLDRVVVFGGEDQTGHSLNDAWALHLSPPIQWERYPGQTPRPSLRHNHAAALEARRMLVFGGYPFVNDLWEMKLDPPHAWRAMMPSAAPPSPRAHHALAFDPDLSAAMIFGGAVRGVGGSPLSIVGDVWYLLPEAVVPVTSTVVRAEPTDVGVEIEWLLSEVSRVSIERREDSTPWGTLGEALVDGSRRVTWLDRGARAGGKFGYRLVFEERGDTRETGEVWVEVPRPAQFSLAAIHPNPALDAISISFSLPGGSPATLEVFDVTGRQVERRDLSPGPGAHRLDLSASAWAAGVHFVRLTQAGRVSVARVAILR